MKLWIEQVRTSFNVSTKKKQIHNSKGGMFFHKTVVMKAKENNLNGVN
jgi:hypothetical protein